MKIPSFIGIKKTSASADQTPSIKVSNQEESSQGFESLKLDKNNENIKIYQTLKKHDIEPTKEMIESIKSEFDQLPGSLNEKISTLNHLLERNIEVTTKNLTSVHRALHYKIDFDYVINEVLPEVESYQTGLDEESISKIQDSVKKKTVVSKEDDESLETRILNKEDDLQIQNQEKALLDPKDPTHREDAVQPESIENLIEDMSDTIASLVSQINVQILAQDNENTTSHIEKGHFKSFLVSEVTKEMGQVKTVFDQFKKQAINRFEMIDQQSKSEVIKNDLQKVINEFKNIILNSKVTLYTSMKDEKRLIRMLSDLEQAETTLNHGHLQEAKRVVKALHNELGKMIFEPKDIKIKGFISKSIDEVIQGKKSLYNAVKSTLTADDKGSRNILQSLRLTGVNHEAEVVSALEREDAPKLQFQSIKSVLMSFKAADNVSIKGEVQESMDHLTGQQLLNKSNVKSDVQSLNLSIPYMADDKIKSLDLYIHSKKKNEVLDWKNTTIYFVMDLKKYGETGIKIQSVNKRLYMTVKNDNPGFRNKTYEAFDHFLQDLTDIGYIKGRLKYTGLSENKDQQLTEENGFVIKKRDEKGFDIKI